MAHGPATQTSGADDLGCYCGASGKLKLERGVVGYPNGGLWLWTCGSEKYPDYVIGAKCPFCSASTSSSEEKLTVGSVVVDWVVREGAVVGWRWPTPAEAQLFHEVIQDPYAKRALRGPAPWPNLSSDMQAFADRSGLAVRAEIYYPGTECRWRLYTGPGESRPMQVDPVVYWVDPWTKAPTKAEDEVIATVADGVYDERYLDFGISAAKAKEKEHS